MWYYALGNERLGPVPEDEIKRLLACGTVRADSLVWTEGMAAWASVAQTPLAAHLPPGPPPPPARSSPPPAYTPGSPSAPLPQPRSDTEIRAIEDLFRWCWILWIAGVVLAFVCVGFLGIVAAVVLGYILLYKYWTIISDGRARTSPGLAVGLSFVPFFHFYWIFVAWHGLTKDMNDYCRRHEIPAPPASESLALTYCILSCCAVIPYVGWFVVAPVCIVFHILVLNSLRETATAILRHRMSAPAAAATPR